MFGFIDTSLQLQLIITPHTLNSFWTMNLLLPSDSRTGLKSLEFWICISTPRIRCLLYLLGGPRKIHNLQGFHYFVSCLRCAGYASNNLVLKSVSQQRTPILVESVTFGNVFS
jgi:hypothetical protein